MKKETGRIATPGMGGFLCPPGHPMHRYHVETNLLRSPENRGGMALDYAAHGEAREWLDEATVAAARLLLDQWQANRPPLDSPEVQEWVLQMLGYFRTMYVSEDPAIPEDERRWAARLVILRDADPVALADRHAGVLAIRDYYPEFTPTAEHFRRAYWGTKPTE